MRGAASLPERRGKSREFTRLRAARYVDSDAPHAPSPLSGPTRFAVGPPRLTVRSAHALLGAVGGVEASN